MDILEITRKQDPLYPTFEQIYTASFPLFEQRTEEQQEQAFQSPNYHLVVYLKDNLFIGFISYWDFSTYVYIEHFAIHENFRGQGYGGLLLEDFNKRLNKIILLEIDPITDEISSKRFGISTLVEFVGKAAGMSVRCSYDEPITKFEFPG